ncbi:MAG: flagellin FliC [Proteobacteria bacterium]|nr:flagellin FliC [Pseudomonadota bacterium]
MGIRINTNIMSVNAQRNLSGSRMSMEKAAEKMSSGSRINRSADDAAGLAISDTLNGHIRSFQQAGRNAQDAISLIQVAEGGMNEVSSMLSRMRELSVQSASDTIGDTERKYLDNEIQQLKNEIDRLAKGTEFNGRFLLNGTGENMDFQIGIHNEPSLDRISYNPGDTNVTLGKLGLSGVGVADKSNAQVSLDVIDESVKVLNGNRAKLGALQNRLTTTVASTDVATENFTAAKSRIKDADIATETAEFARTNIMLQSGISVLAQANQVKGMALKLLG